MASAEREPEGAVHAVGLDAQEEVPDVEAEAEVIRHATAKQMERLGELNGVLLKKVQKAEKEAEVLLAENKDLEAKNAELAGHLSSAKKDVERLEAIQEELSNAYVNLSAAQRDVTARGLEVETAKAEYDVAKGERDAALAKVDALQAELDEATMERDVSRADAADAADARKAAEGEVGELKKALVEAESRETEVRDLGRKDLEREKEAARIREVELAARYDAALAAKVKERDDEWRKRQSLLEHEVEDVLQKHRAGLSAPSKAVDDEGFDAAETGEGEEGETEPQARKELPGAGAAAGRGSMTSSVLGEELVEERVVDERDGDDVLEEVDDEVPVSQEEAAIKRRALGSKTVGGGPRAALGGAGAASASLEVPEEGATVEESASGVSAGHEQVPRESETALLDVSRSGQAVADLEESHPKGESVEQEGGAVENIENPTVKESTSGEVLDGDVAGVTGTAAASKTSLFSKIFGKCCGAHVETQARERSHVKSAALGSANPVDVTEEVANSAGDTARSVVTAEDLKASPDDELDGPGTVVVQDMIPEQSREMEAVIDPDEEVGDTSQPLEKNMLERTEVEEEVEGVAYEDVLETEEDDAVLGAAEAATPSPVDKVSGEAIKAPAIAATIQPEGV